SDANLAEADPSPAGAEDEGRERRGAAAEFAGEDPGEQRQKQDGGEGDRQTGREFGIQAEPEAGGGGPVEQGRFFEPRLAPEAGRNPIARGGHRAPDRGIPRLV